MARILVLGVALALASAAGAAPARPDAHDGALVRQLGAEVTAFQSVASQTSSSTDVLQDCPYFKQHPAQALGAAVVLLPALLIDVVNQFKPQLTGLRDSLAAMHPHSPLFQEWVTAERKSFDLILQFDNHGKKIDFCKTAQVMLAKSSTADDIRAALGVDPALVAKLFQNGTKGPSTTLSRLNPQMRTFLVAGGLSVKQAKALTS